MANNVNNNAVSSSGGSSIVESGSTSASAAERASRPNPFSTCAFGLPRVASGVAFGQPGFSFSREGSATVSSGFSSSSSQAPTTGPFSIFASATNALQSATPQALPSADSVTGQDRYMTGTGTPGLTALDSASHSKGLQQDETRGYLQLLQTGAIDLSGNKASEAKLEEVKTTPLFSQHVRLALRAGLMHDLGSDEEPFPQFGLMGMRLETYNSIHAGVPKTLPVEHNLVFANMNAPWSAFICGSQGAGKSHSLSCLLENALLATSPAGVNPRPLAGLVFHFDKFTNPDSTQVCEAAYLCSSGVPVRILVSPSNYYAMKKLYGNLPGLPKDSPKPRVIPLRFRQEQLNVMRMMTLMAVKDEGQSPLYLELLYKILRDMSRENKGASGIDYVDFKSRLQKQGFSGSQMGPLRLRLALLEEFLLGSEQSTQSADILDSVFNSAQGSLTIIDLSCPFVNENDACALFTICLSLFMENRGQCGRVLALDEAHKFLTKSGEAEKLTDELVSLIRQQRHLATRVIIATQEPTISTSLLDLCNVSIVHRFNSPAWSTVLRNHLAGARLGSELKRDELFQIIVGLRTGEALIFCPSALLDVGGEGVEGLKDAFIKAVIRSRVTIDGGRSIMASDEMEVMDVDEPVAEDLLRPFTAPGQAAAPINPPTTPSFMPLIPATTQQLPTLVSSTAPIQNQISSLRAGRYATNATEATAAFGAGDRARASTILENEVTRSLLNDPTQLNREGLRRAVAAASGWSIDALRAKWVNKIIRKRVDKHVAAYGIPSPTLH